MEEPVDITPFLEQLDESLKDKVLQLQKGRWGHPPFPVPHIPIPFPSPSHSHGSPELLQPRGLSPWRGNSCRKRVWEGFVTSSLDFQHPREVEQSSWSDSMEFLALGAIKILF